MISYGNSFGLWRQATGSAWQEYVGHDFVNKLSDGSLAKQGFLNYLVQDYLFLIHFSRAWALAVTKADTVVEMRACAATVNALVNDEIKLHISLCGQAGIDEESLFSAEEHPANVAYTRYVLDAGHSGDFLDLIMKDSSFTSVVLFLPVDPFMTLVKVSGWMPRDWAVASACILANKPAADT